MDKGLVTRLSTIAAEKAKKTVTKIKAALAEEVMIILKKNWLRSISNESHSP